MVAMCNTEAVGLLVASLENSSDQFEIHLFFDEELDEVVHMSYNWEGIHF